ncbi:flagellar basal body-associated FliL family protein [Thalassococcus sp. CAU 1522]|uniref:Flagellar protein FliL n=1 Tax=Thalassococcus arenae TaxID=2851652 RepID=A0ABS6N6Y6_9RHOB|nr:flagellar basal body-associated FliL family protein [Thalassococcus arenae]MBV2359280.1 flagellar basal body-associated FliL family protein [Thalassococcus arenae]
MSDTTVADAPPPASKKGKLPLILGLVLALAGGGGGFFAVQSGMLDGLLGGKSGDSHAAPDKAAKDDHDDGKGVGDIAFVEIPPLVISLGPNSTARHLRFTASLEVPKSSTGEVTTLMPRIQDVLNGYLRALRPSDIESPGALIELRAQMLRRIQMVVGSGNVRDLLVIEFMLN